MTSKTESSTKTVKAIDAGNQYAPYKGCGYGCTTPRFHGPIPAPLTWHNSTGKQILGYCVKCNRNSEIN